MSSPDQTTAPRYLQNVTARLSDLHLEHLATNGSVPNPVVVGGEVSTSYTFIAESQDSRFPADSSHIDCDTIMKLPDNAEIDGNKLQLIHITNSSFGTDGCLDHKIKEEEKQYIYISRNEIDSTQLHGAELIFARKVWEPLKQQMLYINCNVLRPRFFCVPMCFFFHTRP